jgi:hypothetical protein
VCKKAGIKRSALEGYGKIERAKLIKYANYDADATRRIAVELLSYLDQDYDNNNCWEPFWESMIIQPIILECHQNGIFIDRNRVDDLTLKFLTARSAKEEEIKLTANWPDPVEVIKKKAKKKKAKKKKGEESKILSGKPEEPIYPGFNVRSTQHVKEYLFGVALNGKVTKDGKPIRIRPPGAKSLGIQPLLDTSKPPRRWEDLVVAHKVPRPSVKDGTQTSEDRR